MTPGDGGSRNECWGTNIWVTARPLQPWAAPCLVVVSRSLCQGCQGLLHLCPSWVLICRRVLCLWLCYEAGASLRILRKCPLLFERIQDGLMVFLNRT